MYIYSEYAAKTTVDPSSDRVVSSRGAKTVIGTDPKPGALLLTLMLAAMIAPATRLSWAADPEAGAEMAAPCLSCHSADDFLGESEADILELIEDALADGTHPPDDRGLSDTDLADIAAFFARGE